MDLGDAWQPRVAAATHPSTERTGESQTMPSISARNVTAQLLHRARGNPPGASPASSVGNYYPGLEADLRNIWRRIFNGIELHEAVALVISVAGDAPDPVRALLGEILVSVDDEPIWIDLVGPKSPGGPTENIGNWSLEWSNA